MATATFTKINDFVENLANAIDANADTFCIALSNTAPGSETPNVPTADNNGVLGNVTQIDAVSDFTTAYTNYTDSLTTDRQLESVTSSQTSGTYTLDAADFTITASGGAISTWRYFYIGDDTVATPADPLVGVWDYGSAIDLADGDTANINFNASGILTIA